MTKNIPEAVLSADPLAGVVVGGSFKDWSLYRPIIEKPTAPVNILLPYASLKTRWTLPRARGILDPAMAKKKNQLSRRQQRRVRLQQIIFGLIAVIVIASFVISLVA